MTEPQWLTSTDPAAMVAHLGERITDEQRRLFVEACRKEYDRTYHVDTWEEQTPFAFTAWVEWSKGRAVSKSLRADILRDIVPNPFRPIMQKVGMTETYLHPTDGYIYYDNENFPPNAIRFDPAWLQWQDAAIPAMVDAMMFEECIICVGYEPYFNGEVMMWEAPCTRCGGSERIPRAEPQWLMMPAIADALEAAGCREPAILRHLRGQCPLGPENHDGGWFEGTTHITCPLFTEYHGTGRIRRRHFRGCWALELLSAR